MSVSMSFAQPLASLVLVVDDEEAIREAVRDILELAEIDTVLAANGKEALDLFLQHGEHIGAILLDLRMPIMNGLDTYYAIRQRDPRIPIILSSGYDDALAALDISADRAVSFLRKPYAMDALLTRVQMALTT
jgi:DNA-binding NtrC family response regulator